jgi:murein DD-endopeptidase MepM/ murein hydrolase activator NlpD
MQFIIINNRRGKSTRLHLGPALLTGVLALSLAAGLALFGGGVYFALQASQQTLAGVYEITGSVWQQEMQRQRQAVEAAREEAQQQLDTLAARLSKLQGHVMRLDALGARLAAMAHLDDIEFGDALPGMGGPVASIQQTTRVEDFITDLERLARDLDVRADKLAAMESLLLNRTLKAQTYPDGIPVAGGWISSLFGMRTNPLSGRQEFHEGIDFAGKPRSPVLAVADGIVTWSGRRAGYGNLVEITHGDGYMTRYAHNHENLVSVGQQVSKGQPIAIMGSTGRTTGPHVHFEVVQNGKTVNPKNFISVQ